MEVSNMIASLYVILAQYTTGTGGGGGTTGGGTSGGGYGHHYSAGYWVIVAVIAVVVLSIIGWGIARFRGRRRSVASSTTKTDERNRAA
jgi:hypothetical protein